jgi:DNA-binding transcriptional LysR family regulator
MELRQLEYFVTVAEEANFTRAAARLRVAQPGVSAQVRQLERELGEPLLDRSGRRVRLTGAGAAVLPYARAALSAAAGTRLAIDELRGLVRGSVAVGMVPSCSAVNLPDILADFHRQHPSVVITLSEANSDELVDGVVGGALDLALVGMAGPPPGVDIVPVADEPLVVAVSCDDPLAGRTTTTLTALAERAIISLSRGSGLRAALDRACAAADVRLRVAFEATDPQVLVHLASRGLGVAILPESAAVNSRNQLRVVRIAGPQLRAQLALAWRTGGPVSPAARALIAHARSALQIPPHDPADS